MYRILVADDEAIEREGLELMMKKKMPDIFDIHHAENGRMAIEMADRIKPDIIFMDIKMPGIPGLEAIKEIRTRHPTIKIVLVTAYDYFSYAKDAITLGVNDYILKPAKQEQVINLLKTLIKDIKELKRIRDNELELKEKLAQMMPHIENELSLLLMMDIVHDSADLKQLTELLDFNIVQGQAFVISIPHNNEKQWMIQKKAIFETIKGFVKANKQCMISPMIGNQICIFTSCEHEIDSYSTRIHSIQFAEKIVVYIEKKYNLQVHIGIGTIQKGFAGLKRSYHEASLISAQRSDISNIRHFNDLKKNSKQERYTPIEEKQLFDALQSFDCHNASYLFNLSFNRIVQATSSNLNLCRIEVKELFVSLKRHFQQLGIIVEGITNFENIVELEQLRHIAEIQLEYIVDVLKKDNEYQTFNAIEQAKLFLEGNYMKEIHMENVAEYVNLSPHYFSKLFKKIEGMTFTDFLTTVRIKKAKQLMKNNDISVKEICYLIGYNDPNYFSRVFRKVENRTPTEYRQQHIQ